MLELIGTYWLIWLIVCVFSAALGFINFFRHSGSAVVDISADTAKGAFEGALSVKQSSVQSHATGFAKGFVGGFFKSVFSKAKSILIPFIIAKITFWMMVVGILVRIFGS